VLVEVRQSFLVVPLEITFDDCRHGIFEYGLHPIFGQASAYGPANVPVFSCGRQREPKASDKLVSCNTLLASGRCDVTPLRSTIRAASRRAPSGGEDVDSWLDLASVVAPAVHGR